MKNTKRLLSAVLVLVVMVACMLVITSCNKDEHEHSYTETVTPPTCTSQGFTTHTCECGDSYVDSYVPAGHTMSPHAAKAPTCTESGISKGSHCVECGYVLVEQEELASSGHNYIEGICDICGEIDDSYQPEAPRAPDSRCGKAGTSRGW